MPGCVDGTVQECDALEGAADEVCDGVDNNCDGTTDEELGQTTCGTGVCEHAVDNCVAGVAQICDPLEGAGVEVCNGDDDDCDGEVDESDPNGTCCTADEDCADLAVAPACDDVSSCAGSRTDATCDGFVCVTSVVADSSACQQGVCDDGDACTLSGACDGGQCLGAPDKLFDLTLGVEAEPDSVWGLQVVDDGYLLLTQAGFFPGRHAELKRLDASGAVLWTKTYGEEGVENHLGSLEVFDGGLIMVGSVGQFATPVMRLVRTDENGDVVFDRLYPGLGRSEGKYAQPVDGGFLVVGRTWPVGDFASARALLIRTDAAGNLLDSNLLGDKTTAPSDLTVMPDGGAIIVGARNQNGWLARVDGTGALMWERQLGGDQSEAINTVTPDPSGGFVAAGGTRSRGLGGWDAWLVRFDASGEVLWDRTYGGAEGDLFWKVRPVPDGGYVGGMYTESTADGGWAGALLRMDGDGFLMWQRQYGNEDSQYLWVAVPLADGGYLLGGDNSVGDDVEAWLMRTDAFGNLECGECISEAPADCDDANPCTADLCGDVLCAHDPLPSATPCGEGRSCSDGQCLLDMLVIGQADFTGFTPNGAAPEADTLFAPRDLTAAGEQWVLNDHNNNRVLIFDGEIAGEPAVVLGQKDLTSSMANQSLGHATAATLNGPIQSSWDGENLAVADWRNHRILLWNGLPTENAAPADVVVGQADFFSNLRNRGQDAPSADTLYQPFGVAVGGGKLIIADRNHRLLIYNDVPTTNGAVPDVLIGQLTYEGFEGNAGLPTPEAWTVFVANRVFTDGTRLVVADRANNRVLLWDEIPTEDNTPADVVVGQPTFETKVCANTQTGMCGPKGASIIADRLYVVDGAYRRLLVYNTVPTVSGAPADGVLGQPDFVSGAANRGEASPVANGFDFPNDVAGDAAGIYVTDTNNHRVLRFEPAPTGDTTAVSLHGQDAFNTGDPNKTTPGPLGFDCAKTVAATDAHVVVTDRNNGRALVYDKTTVEDGPIAVIGQPDFESTCWVECEEATATNLVIPEGVAADTAGRLYIGDWYRRRAVLVYNEVPTDSGVEPDYVIGHLDLTTSGANDPLVPAAGRISDPEGVNVISVGGVDKLVVSDCANRRSLIFSLPITANGAVADVVIGQPDFETSSAALTAVGAACPMGAYYDGTYLFIADDTYDRVMVYDGVPTTNGAAAAFVLGQDDFETNDAPLSPSATRFSGLWTSSMASADGYVLVPDSSAGRILAFDTASLSNGMAAARVIGQPGFTTALAAPSNADGTAFKHPRTVTSIAADPDGEHYWVTECGHSRATRIRAEALWNYSAH